MSEPQKATSTVASSFKITPLLAELLNDDALVKKVAVAAPEIQRVLDQMQLDLVTPENKDDIGSVCLALRLVRDVFSTFKTRGEAVLQHEKSQKRKP